MRVVMFVSNGFTADPRVYNEAVSLIRAGHQVVGIAWNGEKQHAAREDWDAIEGVD